MNENEKVAYPPNPSHNHPLVYRLGRVRCWRKKRQSTVEKETHKKMRLVFPFFSQLVHEKMKKR